MGNFVCISYSKNLRISIKLIPNMKWWYVYDYIFINTFIITCKYFTRNLGRTFASIVTTFAGIGYDSRLICLAQWPFITEHTAELPTAPDMAIKNIKQIIWTSATCTCALRVPTSMPHYCVKWKSHNEFLSY